MKILLAARPSIVREGIASRKAKSVLDQPERVKFKFVAPDPAMFSATPDLISNLMTALAFILGVLPLVHATSAGAASLQAIGTAVFYGMIGSTVLGLVFTPVLYVAITAISERIRKPPKYRVSQVIVGSGRAILAPGAARPRGTTNPSGRCPGANAPASPYTDLGNPALRSWSLT